LLTQLRHFAMAEEKPSLPESYKVPDVWEFVQQDGPIGAMNRPDSGPRSEAELSKGEHPIQLYSLGTPNGVKVTILLEELGIEYDAWKISIGKLEQFTSGFCAVNPNSKIPAMYDYDSGDDAGPIRVFESGAILVYLAEKYGKFLPTTARAKAECMSWLMWQMGSAPSIGGGFGHFYNYAPIKIEYAIDRYSMETKRLMDVLDKQLEGKEYVCGAEYTIADMAIMPWVHCIGVGYKADKFLKMDEYKNVQRWMAALKERKAVQRGMRVNAFSDNKLDERHSKADFAPDDY
jgi:GST-like protein